MAYHSSNHRKYTTGNGFYQWHLHAFLERMAQMLSSTRPRTVLDVGCGEGFVIEYLARRNGSPRLMGVDLDEDALAFARQHFGNHAHFRQGDVYALPFSDDAFDTVLCSEVLEHLDAPEQAVRELKRVARRHVLVTVPREPYFKGLNDLGQWLGVGQDPGHVNFWTKRTFQHFIRRHFQDPRFAWKHIYQLAIAAV